MIVQNLAVFLLLVDIHRIRETHAVSLLSVARNYLGDAVMISDFSDEVRRPGGVKRQISDDVSRLVIREKVSSTEVESLCGLEPLLCRLLCEETYDGATGSCQFDEGEQRKHCVCQRRNRVYYLRQVGSAEINRHEKDRENGESEPLSGITLRGQSYGAIGPSSRSIELREQFANRRATISSGSVASVDFGHVDPVVLSWENLSAYMPTRQKIWDRLRRRTDYALQRKQILNNVSGIVCPGQLVALMGASGAGKTTLMNCLTGRNRKRLLVEGSIKINGEEVGSNITAISAYVQQHELAIGTLTVREHLTFQAQLRLPNTYTKAEKIARVDEVIFELGLSRCKDTKIGVAGLFKGISGGEAKRLAFASEIITNPQILFCDEPTTGLDSFMAESIVSMLHGLAAKGKTILCIIQQPPSEVYAMFNRVLFMAEGRVAFLGKAKHALRFFENCGYPCPTDFNPSDHFIQTLAVIPGEVAECKERISMICEAFELSKYAQGLEILKLKTKEHSDELRAFMGTSTKSKCKVGWFGQFRPLLWRSFVGNYRNVTDSAGRMIGKIILGLMVGLVYLQTPINQTGIMNIDGALYQFVTMISIPAMFGVIIFFTQEFPLICREYHDGMYKISSYYVSKIIAQLPVNTLDGVLFVICCYWLIGLRSTVGAFFTCVAICILVEQASVAYGFFVSASSPNFSVTLAIVGPTTAMLNVAGGMFATSATLPPYISWMSYVSWFRLGYEALCINEWHDIEYIGCNRTDEERCYKTGDAVLLHKLTFDPSFFLGDILLLLGCTLFFHVLGYVGLWHRVKKAR